MWFFVFFYISIMKRDCVASHKGNGVFLKLSIKNYFLVFPLSILRELSFVLPVSYGVIDSDIIYADKIIHIFLRNFASIY